MDPNTPDAAPSDDEIDRRLANAGLINAPSGPTTSSGSTVPPSAPAPALTPPALTPPAAPASAPQSFAPPSAPTSQPAPAAPDLSSGANLYPGAPKSWDVSPAMPSTSSAGMGGGPGGQEQRAQAAIAAGRAVALQPVLTRGKAGQGGRWYWNMLVSNRLYGFYTPTDTPTQTTSDNRGHCAPVFLARGEDAP